LISKRTARCTTSALAGRYLVMNPKPGERAKEVNIRSLGFECVVVDESRKEVARPDVLRAMRRFHKYGRFQVQDDVFEVTRTRVARSVRF
jgi:hypothetical protein